MANTPQISFVIPAFNEELVVSQCISSIIRECERNPQVTYEVIVVNNASTDDTALRVRNFSSVRLIDEERQGLVWARQAGFRESSGSLIANLDADTMLPRGWLKKCVQYFDKYPEIIALSGPHRHYDIPFHMRIMVRLYYSCLVYPSYLINRFVIRQGSIIQGGNFVVRKEAMNEIGFKPELYSFYGEDADLSKRLHQVGPVLYTLSFYIYASGRRFLEEGSVRTGTKYVLNYLSVMFRNKPVTQEYSNVRRSTPNPFDETSL